MRRLLIEVSVVHHLSHFFFFNLLSFFIAGLTTMKENKGKNVANGIEEEEDVQV